MTPSELSKRAEAEAKARLRGLKPAQADQLRRAQRLLAAGDRLLAGQLLLDLARSAPDHPEVLRTRAQSHLAEQAWGDAAACLARAAMHRPDDFTLALQLGAVQDQAGAYEEAPDSLRRAGALARTEQEWLALSLEFDRQAYVEDALAAVEQALLLSPRLPVALLQRARCATALGRAELAAADCRALIARGELVARAWFMLADLKVVALDGAELAQLQPLALQPPPNLKPEERVMLLFALGKALEDAGRHAEAHAVLLRANAEAGAVRPWDSAAFETHVAALQAAFTQARPPVPAERGREVVFLVGLPRSGTTLLEQILASHPQVEGASELPYLGMVLEQESRRRSRRLTEWAPMASEADWARLGQEYLALSARWRRERPISTDKLPDNWLHAGAALRMLPGARFIDCRRDPVEASWSCFKQLFAPGRVNFTHSFEGLARYWRAYDGLSRHWAQAHPQRYRAWHYEALVAEPEAQIRALLEFCALPFDEACLRFHEARRAVRTPSALQVRRPMQRASTPAAGYGALLDPLRQLFRQG